MLNKEYYQDIIESAIYFCNHDLKLYKGEEIEIIYEIQPDIRFNAEVKITKEPYVAIFYTEVFNKIYRILNTLLYKENKNFYFCVCNSISNGYEHDKANAYFDVLFEYAVKFIIYHELGHIFNGHVDFMLEEEISNFDRQALEMDADAFAATRCIAQLTYPETISNINKRFPNLISDRAHGFLLCIISACISFSVLGLGDKRNTYNTIDNLKQLEYLPLRTRQDYFIRCAIRAFEFLNPNNLLAIDDLNLNIDFLREIIPNIEQYINLYLNMKEGVCFDSKQNIEELNKLHIKHCDVLDAHWDNIVKNRLRKYSYFIVL